MIRVAEPVIGQEEIAAVVQALRCGQISGSAGEFIEQFEAGFAAYCGCEYGIATSSGSTALHLALAAARVGRGDEVLVSTITNVATVYAIVLNGATPVAVDSEPDTWNMDVSLLERLITPRTRAILPVHIYGHPVDMDPILELAARHRLLVVEDAAEAHGAEYKGRRAGGIGHVGCFSFYANKIITTGEGGMVVTNDPEIAKRARLLRNLAFGEPRFVHHEVAFNYRMTNYQAAMGVAQLRKIDALVERKRWIAGRYRERLRALPQLQLPIERSWAKNVYWMYGVVLTPEAEVSRAEFVAGLARDGVETRSFFHPMHLQPCFLKLGLFGGASCPVAERLGERGIYLPSSVNLDEATIGLVCDAITGRFRST